MIIYLESRAKDYAITRKVLNKFTKASIIEIDHYKNIFDKNIWNQKLKNTIILAKQERIPILSTPSNYWYPGKSFFFKVVMNCMFDCDYCYLKWAFKNSFPVIFVNYEDIQNAITEKIHLLRKSGYADTIYFYASNYSDIQWRDELIQFNRSFIPFFEKFDNVIMESRTKSSNIQSLINLDFVPVNTEISFSLNPQNIIDTYEHKTSSLDQRINAINILTAKWFKVWIRFLPLLPIPNYSHLYQDFISSIKQKIDFEKINSIFIWSIIYTKSDYDNLIKKWNFTFEWKFYQHSDWFMRVEQSITQEFKNLFTSNFPNKYIYLIYYNHRCKTYLLREFHLE
jgi:spore photoproduct lyase